MPDELNGRLHNRDAFKVVALTTGGITLAILILSTLGLSPIQGKADERRMVTLEVQLQSLIVRSAELKESMDRIGNLLEDRARVLDTRLTELDKDTVSREEIETLRARIRALEMATAKRP